MLFHCSTSVQNITKAGKTDRAESLVAANSQTADGYKEDHFDDDGQQKTVDTSSQKLKQLLRVLSGMKVCTCMV